jgi:succinate dehydrogenase hydrophobic anchor subunit
MIILRYVPHDEAGYQNYFRDFDDPNNTFATFITFFKYFIWSSISIIAVIIYFIKKSDLKTTKMTLVLLIKAACYILSIVLIFNLMNIVMTFRTNTKPILKTKNLSWSLQKTYTQLYEEYTPSQLTELETEIKDQYSIFIYIKNNMDTVRFCLMAGSTTSHRKMVLVEQGRALG